MKISILILMTFLVFKASSQDFDDGKIKVRKQYIQCDVGYGFFYDLRVHDMAQVIWNFGDGTPPVTILAPNSSTIHIYLLSGIYEVTAEFTSDLGVETTVTFMLNVTVGNPIGGAGFTFSGGTPEFSFNFTGAAFSSDTYNIHSYTLDFGDGTTPITGDGLALNELIGSHTFSQPGNHTVTLTHTFDPDGDGENCEWIYQLTLFAPEDPCCANFSPDPGKEYWLSAWVQEELTIPVISYSNNVYVEIKFIGASGNQYERIYPSEDIIEDWQRIVGKFLIPDGTTSLEINMVNENAAVAAFFDDIRIHPFNASMKSYVYDPETLWLTAELDDNNYATFYEYDMEGQLVRIKKETERGIMTIQESRSSQTKKN